MSNTQLDLNNEFEILTDVFINSFFPSLDKTKIMNDMNTAYSEDSKIIGDFIYEVTVTNPIPIFSGKEYFQNEITIVPTVRAYIGDFKRHLIEVLRKEIESTSSYLNKQLKKDISNSIIHKDEIKYNFENVINDLGIKDFTGDIFVQEGKADYVEVFITNKTNTNTISFYVEYSDDVELFNKNIIKEYLKYRYYFNTSLDISHIYKNILSVLNDYLNLNY